MSNPSTVSASECSEYDAACVASVTHAEALRSQTDVPVHPLLQCTDLEEFEARNEPGVRTGTVFVGNSRGVRRPCLDWAIEFGLDLRIYGGGWGEWRLGACVRGDYVANEELPRLYAESRMTLNDHWRDMMGLGYINNRTFDSLAAGMIVISDDFPELRGVCGDALLYYRDQASFNLALTEALLAGPSVAERQRALWRTIREDFSFERRAQQVWELASEIQQRRRQGDDPRSDRDLVVDGDPADGARLEVITAQLAERGGGRYCPLCATRADDFARPGNVAPTNEDRCPSCGAASRDRLFWLYLVNDLWPRLPSDLKRLLHIAPDEHLASALHQRDDVNYLSGDISMPNVKVRLDLTDLQFPGDRFDLIVCSGHVDRLAADRRALEELQRVTKPGGYTLVQNPVETTACQAEQTPPDEISARRCRRVESRWGHRGPSGGRRISGLGSKVYVRATPCGYRVSRPHRSPHPRMPQARGEHG